MTRPFPVWRCAAALALAACANPAAGDRSHPDRLSSVGCEEASLAAFDATEGERARHDAGGEIVRCIRLAVGSGSPDGISDHTVQELAARLSDPIVGAYAALAISSIGPRARDALPFIEAAIALADEEARGDPSRVMVDLDPRDHLYELCRAKASITRESLTADSRCARFDIWEALARE